MTPTRPVLRWHGGKWRLAPWIIGHFPAHDIYVEPYGGAASVLLRKSPCPTDVWNDLDDNLYTLFALLRDAPQAEALIRACELTPFSRRDFDLSYTPVDDPVERCRRFIVRSFFGYGSKTCISHARNGFRCLRRGDASPAVDWSRYPDALRAIVRRFAGVVIECRPALEVIRRFDRPETLFFVDPPYVQSTRNLKEGSYLHEMTDQDHIELAATLRGIQGRAIVSGYPSTLYSDLYQGWRTITRKAYADKASPRTECLWLSPRTSAALLPLAALEHAS